MICNGLSGLTPDLEELVKAAIMARDRAYAPYSNYQVGAALRTESGEIYLGCNVENASFGATMCAERVAIYSAIAKAERSFRYLALVSEQSDPLSPCGICRQVIAEIAPNITLLMANLLGDTRVATIQELLPLTFNLPANRSIIFK